jgi:hypothetical protein
MPMPRSPATAYRSPLRQPVWARLAFSVFAPADRRAHRLQYLGACLVAATDSQGPMDHPNRRVNGGWLIRPYRPRRRPGKNSPNRLSCSAHSFWIEGSPAATNLPNQPSGAYPPSPDGAVPNEPSAPCLHIGLPPPLRGQPEYQTNPRHPAFSSTLTFPGCAHARRWASEGVVGRSEGSEARASAGLVGRSRLPADPGERAPGWVRLWV